LREETVLVEDPLDLDGFSFDDLLLELTLPPSFEGDDLIFLSIVECK
jgi:hypothetical protein